MQNLPCYSPYVKPFSYTSSMLFSSRQPQTFLTGYIRTFMIWSLLCLLPHLLPASSPYIELVEISQMSHTHFLLQILHILLPPCRKPSFSLVCCILFLCQALVKMSLSLEESFSTLVVHWHPKVTSP